jgi:hypothetical protein
MLIRICFLLIFSSLTVLSFAQSKKTTVKKSATSSKSTDSYIVMCGEKYKKGTNFESMLPSGWEDRVGFYCMKNYREGASSVNVSGANSKGILIKAIGENSGDTHLVLYTCDGELF